MSQAFESRGTRHAMAAQWDGEQLTWSDESGSASASLRRIDDTTLLLENSTGQHRVRYARRGHDVYVLLDGRTLHLHAAAEAEDEGVASGVADPVVRAPMPGKVVAVLVAEGDHVEAGQPVAQMEAMKMEVDLTAPLTGTVQRVHVAADEVIDLDASLVTLASEDS